MRVLVGPAPACSDSQGWFNPDLFGQLWPPDLGFSGADLRLILPSVQATDGGCLNQRRELGPVGAPAGQGQGATKYSSGGVPI